MTTIERQTPSDAKISSGLFDYVNYKPFDVEKCFDFFSIPVYK